MSKWDGIHKASQVENPKSETEKELELNNDALDTDAELRQYILNNDTPTDTVDELKARKRNHGPKDTPLENEGLINTPKP